MIELEARFRIVTPLFMSGSDKLKAELRVPSIKGVLRFWWRALALGRLDTVKKVREENLAFSAVQEMTSVNLGCT